jgi:hypothetical protein
MVSRRDVLRLGTTAITGSLVGSALPDGTAHAAPRAAAAVSPTAVPIERSCYLTFCRIPTAGLATWKSIMDSFAEDGVTRVVLWLGGAFRSKKYPITWQYNESHRNVRENFVGDLIEYAHTLGIRILLGFTPYTYDGTNQYAFERPDLKGLQADGRLARMQGIHSWGYNLDPTKADAKRFMLDYARELYFDFYPNADGLLIESSDIDICTGGDCGGPQHYYEVEFEFVRQLSDEVWARDPDAEIIVHPNYFVGGANGAELPYDPRWTVIFSPWTVDLDFASTVSRAYYFDLDVISQPPANVAASVRWVRDNGFASYFPSQEFFTYVARHAEIGETNVIGRQLYPFGLDFLGLDENPYTDPVVTVNRVALREYAQNPDLPTADFHARLGKAVFGDTATDQDIADLLFVHDICYGANKSLFTLAVRADPRAMRDRLERGVIGLDELRGIQDRLDALPAVAKRISGSPNPAVRRLARHTRLIEHNWDTGSRDLLAAHLRT